MSAAEADRFRVFETRLLTQLEQRAKKLVKRKLPGKSVETMAVGDGTDALRNALRRMNRRDPDLLDSLPGNRAIQIHFKRGLWATLRGTPQDRVRATTIVPVESIVSGDDAAPAGRDAVLDALARYEVMPRNGKPSIVVLGSASGFSDAAWDLARQPGPPHVVLISPRGDGGWDIRMSDAMRKSDWAVLFEFETADERQERLQYHLSQQIEALETRGLSMDELAALLGVAPEQVGPLVERACRSDRRLMVVVHDGQRRLARSPLADEERSMSMWSRIRRWLGLKPSIAQQVRDLTQQRVKLEQARGEIDGKIERLEKDERSAVQSGASAKTLVEKKQLAGKLVRVRRELTRFRTQAQVYTNQIEVLGTHIHHLSLKQQGAKMDLPSAEDLTRSAAEAESVMAELSANAELAQSIEVGMMSPGQSDAEDEILKEFEREAGVTAAQPAATSTAREAMPPLPSEPATAGRERANEAPARMRSEGPQAG